MAVQIFYPTSQKIQHLLLSAFRIYAPNRDFYLVQYKAASVILRHVDTNRFLWRSAGAVCKLLQITHALRRLLMLMPFVIILPPNFRCWDVINTLQCTSEMLHAGIYLRHTRFINCIFCT